MYDVAVGVWDVVVVGAVWVTVRRRDMDTVFAEWVDNSVVVVDLLGGKEWEVDVVEVDDAVCDVVTVVVGEVEGVTVDDAVRSTDNVAVRMPVVEGVKEKVIVGEPDAVMVCESEVVAVSDSVTVTVRDRVALRVEQVQG